MINVSIYQGRLVSNPEKKMSVDSMYILFTIAVPRSSRKEGGKTADFFDCIAWDKNAELIYKYFFQGDSITVKGRTETNDYVDKSGIKKRSYTLVVEDWEFGPKKKSNESEVITPSSYNLNHRK